MGDVLDIDDDGCATVQTRSGWSIGDRCEAGEPGTDEHDTGVVQGFDGDSAIVGWDSGVRTPCALADLRAA